MRIVFVLVCNFLLLTTTVIGQVNSKTILGIFTHPDDENMIGHVLAKYARLGNKVYIIIATDGKDGTRVTNIPAGDSLGKIRQLESTCACEKLGINPPIFLNINRLDTKYGVRPFLSGREMLLTDIKKTIQTLQPDLLITFGPEGEYGHAEHIVTGAIVIDLLLREGWVEKYPLYFPVDKKGDVEEGDGNSFVDDRYLNVAITYTEEDETKSFEAAKCYVSQFEPEEIKNLIDDEVANKTNTKFFRQFSTLKVMKNEFDFKK